MNYITTKLLNLSIDNKQKIIKLFNDNIKNKEIKLDNKNHDGKEGYWLETQFNIKHNSRSEPDIYGYELKKNACKITFGDFSASEYLFSKNKKYIDDVNKLESDIIINRTEFIKYFGKPNVEKNNRYSWSGSCIPKYNIYNDYGQQLIVNENQDICIYYSYSKDIRNDKHKKIPKILQKDNILIAYWKSDKLREKINNKFNQKGFIICKKTDNKYTNICFGKSFDYNYFIDNIKNYNIFFDSGMYEGNNRNYSQFRANSSDFWNKLIIETY